MKCDFCGRKNYKLPNRDDRRKNGVRYHCESEAKFMNRLMDKGIALSPIGRIYLSAGARICLAARDIQTNNKDNKSLIKKIKCFEKRYGVKLYQSWDFDKRPFMRRIENGKKIYRRKKKSK